MKKGQKECFGRTPTEAPSCPLLVFIKVRARDTRTLLLAQSQCYVYGAGYGATYHGVVTDTQEAHHLYVCGY